MVLVVPSPKFQFHAVTLPVEVSVNATFKDAVPVVGLALKLATGRRCCHGNVVGFRHGLRAAWTCDCEADRVSA